MSQIKSIAYDLGGFKVFHYALGCSRLRGWSLPGLVVGLNLRQTTNNPKEYLTERDLKELLQKFKLVVIKDSYGPYVGFNTVYAMMSSGVIVYYFNRNSVRRAYKIAVFNSDLKELLS